MVFVQRVCIFLYAWQMPKFIYSEVIVERSKLDLNVADPIKCSGNDLLCLKNNFVDDLSLVGYSDDYDDDTVTQSYYGDEKNTNYDETYVVNNEMVHRETFRADDYPNDSKHDFSVKSVANKVKRSLELVEEQPPEGTYRSPSNENEATTTRTILSAPSMPSTPSIPSTPSTSSTPKSSFDVPSGLPQAPTAMPSMPSIPQPPTMPSTEPQYVNQKAERDVTTPSSDVETLETTTADYEDDGEPNCDYDPFTWIFKCGLNLITSLLGFSDTCCKPLI